MKITSVTRGMDKATFCPLLTVEFQLGLEILQDATVQMGEDEFATVLGKELLLQLKVKMAEMRATNVP
jgi:hypothetical protein